MKESIFRNFFTAILAGVLCSSFVSAQKTGATVNKTSTTNNPTINKSAATTKLATPGKSTPPAKSQNAVKTTTASLPPTEQAILDEINVARTQPQKYIGYLQEYRKLYTGNTYSPPDGSTAIVTNEGTAAVDDAISALKAVTSLAPYTISTGLTQSANLQLKDLMEDSSIGHRSKDGGNLTTRLAKFGEVGSTYAENITYFAKTPRQVVIEMLIDDGVAKRSHRKNVLNPTFKQIGLGFGNGKKGETLCVAVFADSFRNGAGGGMRQL